MIGYPTFIKSLKSLKHFSRTPQLFGNPYVTTQLPGNPALLCSFVLCQRKCQAT